MNIAAVLFLVWLFSDVPTGGGGGKKPEPPPPPLPDAVPVPVPPGSLRQTVMDAMDEFPDRSPQVLRGAYYLATKERIEILESPLPDFAKGLLGNVWDALLGKEPTDDVIAKAVGLFQGLANIVDPIDSVVEMVRVGQAFKWMPPGETGVTLRSAITEVIANGLGLVDGGDAPPDDCQVFQWSRDVVLLDPDGYSDGQFDLPLAKILAARATLLDIANLEHCAHYTHAPVLPYIQYWIELGVPPDDVRWAAAELYYAVEGSEPATYFQTQPYLQFLAAAIY